MFISAFYEHTVPPAPAQLQMREERNKNKWSRACHGTWSRKWTAGGFCFVQGGRDVYFFISRTYCVPRTRATPKLKGEIARARGRRHLASREFTNGLQAVSVFRKAGRMNISSFHVHTVSPVPAQPEMRAGKKKEDKGLGARRVTQIH